MSSYFFSYLCGRIVYLLHFPRRNIKNHYIMKQTERTNKNRLFKHLLFALVMLLPIGAWGQTNCGLFIGDYEGYYPNTTPVGVRVTSENASNITHACIKSGKVSFESASRTLTLEDATIDGSIYSYGDLTINLVGENYVTATDSSAIVCEISAAAQNLTIKGTGRLMALPYSDVCVNGFNTPSYEDGQSLLLGNLYYASVIGTQLFSGGTGSSADTPYLISTAADLKNLAFYVNEGLLSNKFYELQNDIDCTNKSGFVPIGNSVNYPFTGTFNGNNKKIIGLDYTATNTADYVGLFARVGVENGSGGTIKNLELKDCSFGGSLHVGAIAGYFLNGSMEYCKVSGNTTISAVGDGAEAGALIGNYLYATLTSNYYYYSVTTSTQGPNDPEPIEKMDISSEESEMLIMTYLLIMVL